MSIEKDQIYHRFTQEVLNALHIRPQSFFCDIDQKHPYEVLIHKWIHKLYTKGKTLEETIEYIYRARRLFILRTYNGPRS